MKDQSFIGPLWRCETCSNPKEHASWCVPLMVWRSPPPEPPASPLFC